MPATATSSLQNAVLASVAISPNDAFDAITDFRPLLDRLFCDSKRLPTKWMTADTYMWLSKRTIGDVVLRTKQHKTLQPVIDVDAGAINLLRTFVTQLEQRLADIEWGKLIGVVYRLLELKLFRSPEDTANMPHHNEFHRESEFVRSDGFDLRSYACIGPKREVSVHAYRYLIHPPAPRYWRMTLVNIAVHEPTLLEDMVKAATELKRPPVSVEATLLSLSQQPETLACATASHAQDSPNTTSLPEAASELCRISADSETTLTTVPKSEQTLGDWLNEEKAIAIAVKNYGLSVADIAKRLGVHRNSPRRWPRFMTTWKGLQTYMVGTPPPRGSKDRKGNLEAEDDSE